MRRPSPSAVIAIVALFVAVGGPAQAARLIGGDDIKKGAVGSKHVKDRSIKPRDLSRGAVQSLMATPMRSIVDAHLADAAVTTRALAPGSVLTGTVGDNSLTAADLASSSVGTEEVGDNAVGQTEIRNNGVGASEIVDNAIDGGEIIDGGLSVRDVARGAGSFEWEIGTLAPEQCETDWVQLAGAQISGDLVLVSPISGWPRDLVYTANGTGSEVEFKIQACNRGGAPVAGAKYLFNFAFLGS
jgi:hypothetical protein